MKIIDSWEITATVIDTDETDFPTYRRYSSGNWEQLMGQSWEPVYSGEKELEQMYQEWLKEKQNGN